MAAPPLKEEVSAPYPVPSNAEMRIGMGKLWDYVTGLLGATGNAAEARAALLVAPAPRVMGLTGNVNATTPLTKFDLAADLVVMRDADGGTVGRYSTGTLTCDLGLAGAAANGRDQAAAFTANSWINLFFIWNGTTLATIASTASHTTGPTLPTGYTHWCYATTIRWNASSNIIPAIARGAKVAYNIANAGAARILSDGVATVMTSVSYASVVPPVALLAMFNFIAALTHSSDNTFVVNVRNGGATHSGEIVAYFFARAGINSGQTAYREYPNVPSQSISYNLSGAPSTSGGLNIEVLGYTVPNGDS